MMVDDVTIIVPTLNEADAIVKVVEEIKSVGMRRILVVDGGSTDGTVELAEKAGALVIM